MTKSIWSPHLKRSKSDLDNSVSLRDMYKAVRKDTDSIQLVLHEKLSWKKQMPEALLSWRAYYRWMKFQFSSHFWKVEKYQQSIIWSSIPKILYRIILGPVFSLVYNVYTVYTVYNYWIRRGIKPISWWHIRFPGFSSESWIKSLKTEVSFIWSPSK